MAVLLMVGGTVASGEEPTTLAPVVVTATKTETPEGRLGASVTVISEEEIEAYNYGRIEEALRQVPGVEIRRSGGPGRTTSISIRGAGSQRVQVLVDGMRVKSPTLGVGELSELTLDAIERIEVVRGPQSTLYGADAIGGVVNIITKKGQGPPRASVWVEGGSYETFREQANVQGAWGRFNYNVSGMRLDTSGQFDNDDADQTSFGGRLGYDFPWKGELSLTGRYSKIHLDLPIFGTSPTVFDPNSQNQLETYLWSLTYEQPIFSWWDTSVRYGQWANNSGFQDEPPPGTTTTDSQINTRRLEAELLNSFHVGRWDTLTVGLERRSEVGRNRTTGTFPARFRREIDTTAVFVQNELRLFDRVFLGGGVRWEDNEEFGDEVTPRASIALVVRETGTRLRGAWGQGFRAPTVNDLFFPGFGNPDLAPERSESWEAGFDQAVWANRVRFGATYFHNRFEDLIQFVFDPVTFTFLPENVGRATTEGVEAYVEVDPLDWLTAYANYTLTASEDLDTGRELRRVPRHRWSAGVHVTPIARLALFAQANVLSSQLESDFAGRNPGYYRIDAGGTLRLLGRAGVVERLDLTARIENLTDERYEEVLGFRALGLNAMVGLRAYFR
ncbi:MAG: TonB-dependent receptor plug domain-containing protein [Candidatus Rokuibacteriota bacterium]